MLLTVQAVDFRVSTHPTGLGFFFSSRRRHTTWNCDWSSDMCSSDLAIAWLAAGGMARAQTPTPAAVAAAKELVLIKGATAMFDPLNPGVIESAKNGFLPTNPQLAQPLKDRKSVV